jgi:hypothetical protein
MIKLTTTLPESRYGHPCTLMANCKANYSQVKMASAAVQFAKVPHLTLVGMVLSF